MHGSAVRASQLAVAHTDFPIYQVLQTLNYLHN